MLPDRIVGALHDYVVEHVERVDELDSDGEHDSLRTPPRIAIKASLPEPFVEPEPILRREVRDRRLGPAHPLRRSPRKAANGEAPEPAWCCPPACRGGGERRRT